MSWIADMSPSRKRAMVLGAAAVLGVAVVLGGGFAIISGTSHAADASKENCQGLDRALQNNLKSIAQQKAHPDAQSAARIKNREAVVAQIEQRLQAAGCDQNGNGNGNNNGCPTSIDTSTPPATTTDNGMGNGGMGSDTTAPPTTTTTTTGNGNNGNGNNNYNNNNNGNGNNNYNNNNGLGNGGMGSDTTAPPTTTTTNNYNNYNNNGMGGAYTSAPPTTSDNNGGCDNGGLGGTDTTAPTDTNTGVGNMGSGNTGTAANQVCKGSTVTLSGQQGLSASSNQFPVGTRLKVTNLDNNQSITVPVTSTSGSCVLLDDDAFNKIHEQGKQLIRHALIQKVG